MSFVLEEYFIVKPKNSFLESISDKDLKYFMAVHKIYRGKNHSHDTGENTKTNIDAVKYIHLLKVQDEFGGAHFISEIFDKELISCDTFDKYWAIEIAEFEDDINQYRNSANSINRFMLTGKSSFDDWIREHLTSKEG